MHLSSSQAFSSSRFLNRSRGVKNRSRTSPTWFSTCPFSQPDAATQALKKQSCHPRRQKGRAGQCRSSEAHLEKRHEHEYSAASALTDYLFNGMTEPLSANGRRSMCRRRVGQASVTGEVNMKVD